MKKLFFAAAILAVLFSGAAVPSFAQLEGNGHVPATSVIAVRVGVIIICNLNVNNGVIVVAAPIADPNGNVATDPPDANSISGSGSASFQSIASTQTPVASTTYAPVSLNFSGSDPTYGTFSFSFDASRPPTNSTVTANQAGNDFPATADIYANVSGTVSGLPGTYTNNSECHMNATINSWNPQNNETYTFVNDVTFSNPDDPAAPTFTIPAGTAVVLN